MKSSSPPTDDAAKRRGDRRTPFHGAAFVVWLADDTRGGAALHGTLERMSDSERLVFRDAEHLISILSQSTSELRDHEDRDVDRRAYHDSRPSQIEEPGRGTPEIPDARRSSE